MSDTDADTAVRSAGTPGDLIATSAPGGRRSGHPRRTSRPRASYAPENIEAIWVAGLGNLLLAADLGGLGADPLTASRVIETVAAATPQRRSSISCTSFSSGT